MIPDGTYYLGYPKRDPNFDNYAYGFSNFGLRFQAFVWGQRLSGFGFQIPQVLGGSWVVIRVPLRAPLI